MEAGESIMTTSHGLDVGEEPENLLTRKQVEAFEYDLNKLRAEFKHLWDSEKPGAIKRNAYWLKVMIRMLNEIIKESAKAEFL